MEPDCQWYSFNPNNEACILSEDCHSLKTECVQNVANPYEECQAHEKGCGE